MNILDTNLNFNSNYSKGNKPEFIVLHHAAISKCSIEEVHAWHKARGWAGCGYHYLIRKNGEIYRGRDDDMIGAHCKNHNKNSIGICCEGNFMKEILTENQKLSLQELCQYLIRKYNINTIYGHKELGDTSCPGAKFPLEEMKKIIFESSYKEGDVQYCGYLIKLNSNKYDENVKLIQQELVELGYDIGSCGVDGYYGEATRAAVILYQKDMGILVDGVVGPVTWKALFLNKYEE